MLTDESYELYLNAQKELERKKEEAERLEMERDSRFQKSAAHYSCDISQKSQYPARHCPACPKYRHQYAKRSSAWVFHHRELPSFAHSILPPMAYGSAGRNR